MAKGKRLSSKQLAALEDIFAGQLDEQALLEKHKINKNTYYKWLADENFRSEFAKRIEFAQLQSRALVAKYGSVAVAKLINLTESENQETARKACLDIMSLADSEDRKTVPNETEIAQKDFELSGQTAEKLLAALAETKDD